MQPLLLLFLTYKTTNSKLQIEKLSFIFYFIRPPRPRAGRHQQQASQPVRYSFAESDDDSGEKEEDPIAWALASRAGQVNVEVFPSYFKYKSH